MQCYAPKAADNDEGLFLPKFNQVCYPQTPQPGCKVPEKNGFQNAANSFLITETVSTSCDTATSSPRSLKEVIEEPQPTSILDKLHIGKTLGVGASCKVKMAQDPEGNKYALKILNSNNHFKRFIDAEVETLSMINHPNIVNLIEHGEGLQGESMKPF